jgi:tRNA-dihydrouridine synthase B
MPDRDVNQPWALGGLPIPNRVVLAPLAGIGNWFVRWQAQRHGAGMAFSEMVSSHAIHHRNERTHEQLLRIDARERVNGPVAMQLFGADPEIMRSAARTVAGRGADLIDLNMGCPVPKVMKTGAGAALLSDPETAVAVARAAGEGSGLPVTVKLRASQKKGGMEGVELAKRLVADAGVVGLTFHPRSAQVRHAGSPDYDLARDLVRELSVPVIVSGGMQGAEHVRRVFEHTGCAAVMIARGGLGDPWLFERVLGGAGDADAPSRADVLTELRWMVDRACEHYGPERAARWLKKAYPWYLSRLGEAPAVQDALQRTDSVNEARALINELDAVPAA